MDNSSDSHVFMKDEFIYGVRARGNAGLGLWQLAHMSKQPLTESSFEAARTAMVSLKADHGAPLGVTPNVLVVPPSLEPAARRLLKATALEASSNIWFGSAELIVSPYIS
jgi:phage major head subunit gpT-like protein